MSRGQLAVLAALAAVVLLFTGAIAGGRDGAGGDLRQGPQRALGDLLTRPASLSDLAPARPDCVRDGRLVVPRDGACAYALRSGFFAKRLRLRLAAPGGVVTAVLTQPKPEVTDTERIDDGGVAELTYRQDGSRLTLRCAGGEAPACVVMPGD